MDKLHCVEITEEGRRLPRHRQARTFNLCQASKWPSVESVSPVESQCPHHFELYALVFKARWATDKDPATLGGHFEEVFPVIFCAK